MLANVSSIATMLVILVLFRRIRWMILPFVVVQVSLIWMRALMSDLGDPTEHHEFINYLLITVIGIATSIHVAFRFRDECARDGNLHAALERMLAGLIGPIFWTSPPPPLASPHWPRATSCLSAISASLWESRRWR